ncbi:MAG: stage II sporulation protein M [Paenibacillaceae bacterium]|nr:stage II sporulation protein M [Paenibacillaceae bacterium]
MRRYVKERLPLYVFTAVVLMTGVIFGAVMVGALTLEQQQELSRHVGSYVQELGGGGMAATGEMTVWQHAVDHGKWIVLIWLLGLTVVGFPLIFGLVFVKGILIGFTVGYMIGEFSWRGAAFSFAAVVPQNLVVIPALLVCSVSAVAFALHLIRRRILQRTGSIYEPFIHCSLVAVCTIFLLTGVSLYETYVSPDVIRLVTPLFAPQT